MKCAQNAFSTLGKACSFDRLGYCGQRATVDELLPSQMYSMYSTFCVQKFLSRLLKPDSQSGDDFWLPNPSATTMPQPVPEVTEGLSFSQ